MDLENSICPICGSKAKQTVHGKVGSFQYDCEVCGNFITYKNIIETLEAGHYSDKRWLLSGSIRRVSETNHGEVVDLNIKKFNEYIETIPISEDPLEKIDSLLLYIYRHTDSSDKSVDLKPYNNYPLFFLKSKEEFSYIINQAVELHLIEKTGPDQFDTYRLSVKGWERLRLLKEKSPDSKTAFIAMWFCDEKDKKYYETLENMYNLGICKALEATGFIPDRAKEAQHNNDINDYIIGAIKKCKFLIADFTGQRQGVYFEAGFARGLGKEVIWTVRKDEIKKCHFDTNHINHLVWKDPDDLKTQLINRINATIK